jgi:hypothetical protein
MFLVEALQNIKVATSLMKSSSCPEPICKLLQLRHMANFSISYQDPSFRSQKEKYFTGRF